MIVRGADTLAVGHGRQRRVGEAGGAGTLVRRYQPKSVFLWGSTPFLWARPKKWGGTAGLSTNTQQRIGEFRRGHMPGCGRQGPSAKGGTPGEGSPFDPLLRFFEHGAFRALRRAARGAAPGPRPLFCKKAGQKTFITGRGHFPTQKRENMRSVTSSRTLRPVSSASASRASSASVSTASGVKPAASVSHAASSAASARWTASA